MMKNRIVLFVSLFLGVFLVGCSDKDESESYYPENTDALISDFELEANIKYASGLADVYFSIVQQGEFEEGKGYVGQIFNADSLPVGTITKSLLAKITTNNPYEIKLFNYSEATKQYSDSSIYTSTDSINFTHPVLVRVTAANRVTQKYYEVKLNVHKQNPDSIHWELYKENAVSNFTNIEQQKAVAFGSDIYWYTANSTNVYLNKSPNTDLSTWTSTDVSWTLSSKMELSTLTVYDDEIYCLTSEGEMMKSSDGISFTAAMADNSDFVNIIGVYGMSSNKQLVALRNVSGTTYFSYYTNQSGWVNSGVVPSDFPITGFSNSVSYTVSKRDRLNIVGGKTAAGNLVSAVWSYDGVDEWAKFPQRNLIGTEGVAIISYEHDPRYKDTFWFMFCGKTGASGYSNRIYYSKDKGVSWSEASSLVTFPSNFTARAFVSPYVGNDFYINLIGGDSAKGELNQVWRGRLNNLVFKPVE